MEKIALFGTSADPPTAGHRVILEWLGERYDQVAVWASDNPFKTHGGSLEQRMEMLEILIGDVNKDNVRLYPELSDRRSLIGIERARRKWGEGEEYSLVIGSDLLPQLEKWYRIGEILKMVKILIFPRRGYPIGEKDLEKLRELGGTPEIVNASIPGTASSDYRHHRDNGNLIEAVREYIEREKLYL